MLSALAAAALAAVPPAAAAEYNFSNSFVWTGASQVSFEAGGLVATAVITGRNVDIVGPAIMMNTSQTCTFVTRMPLIADVQEAEGVCETVDADGDKAFLEFSCAGTRMTCDGTWAFTGGTGKFAGITGEGTTIGVTEAMHLNGTSNGLNRVAGTLILPN